MNPSDYLESLILGQENSSIPVQTSELRLLKKFMEMEKEVDIVNRYRMNFSKSKDAREILTNTRNRLLADNMYRDLISEIDTWLNR